MSAVLALRSVFFLLLPKKGIRSFLAYIRVSKRKLGFTLLWSTSAVVI